MISEPSDLRTWTARGYLENGILGMEKQQGQKLVKAFPDTVVEGLTKNGTGFAFQSRVTRDSRGQGRFTAYYAFATGARFQAFIIMTDRSETMQTLLKAFSPAFEQVQTSAPVKNVRSWTGVDVSFFNYTVQLPAQWKYGESPYANLAVYHPGRLPGSAYVFGSSNHFVVETELQPGNPVSPVAALSSFLSKRSTTVYKNWHSPEDALRIERIDELQLPDGRQIVGLALRQDNDDRFYLGAWLINGPGYSLIVSGGFKLFRYDLIKRGSTAATEHRAWYAFYESLAGLAASVKWDNRSIQRNASAENYLKSQKRFRYRRESFISGESISVASSNVVEWDFYSDNRVNFKMDKFTSFNSYDFNPNQNYNDWSSGYLTQEKQGKDSLFQVWNAKGRDYIVVMRPAGVATFHPLTTAPFTIDGFENGCCR
ncbi:MAG: hypothetical protein CMN76_12045 [Spirochaetaceae bacterium]|nr:hypothetical protein [Spirochaetaceae bacterium]|tara:strand:+ start:22473 stop:23753 length:1281 start_codon:yes stop_codon:yes gene_type:complete